MGKDYSKKIKLSDTVGGGSYEYLYGPSFRFSEHNRN